MTVDKIAEKVEGDFVKSVRRVRGLELLSEVMGLNGMTQFMKESLMLTFVAALREGRNQMTHYLHNISICSHHLQQQMRSHFFAILKSILKSVRQSKNEKHIVKMLDALVWKFTGRDHPDLSQLQLFKTL